tara:strand:+ start:33 stop:263 length:231 start_codon:yes stop_codon:yes gene_type:complete
MDEPFYQSQTIDLDTVTFLLKNNYKNENEDVKNKVDNIIKQLIQQKKIKSNSGSQQLYHIFTHKEYIKLINDILYK